MNWINQVGAETNYLFSVYFINDSTGFAVGTNGLILKTTNGGINSTYDIPFENDIKIYPNPNNGEFYLEFNNPSGKSFEIQISDFSGGKIFETSSSQSLLKVSLGEMPKGMYIMTITGIDTRIKSKIIVQ